MKILEIFKQKFKQIFKCKKKAPPADDLYKMEPLPANMKIHTVYKGRVIGKENLYIWEINGVMFKAGDIIEAHRKYLRKTKQEEEE